MGAVRITVQDIRPPQPDRKRGSVTTTDGRKFGIFQEKVHLIQTGRTYDVEITDGQYPNIQSARPVNGNSNGHSDFTSGAYRDDAPARQPKNTYRETCQTDAERMFVCATLGALIKAGEVKNNKQQLWEATQMLRGLWKHTFGDTGTFRAGDAGHHMVA